MGDLKDSVAPEKYKFILLGTDIIGKQTIEVPFVIEIVSAPLAPEDVFKE